MIVFEEKFKKGDYIINRTCGDMAIYDKTDKNGYMHFEYYYGAMLHSFHDITKYTMQINYQKFYELCNDEEKLKFDKIIKSHEKK